MKTREPRRIVIKNPQLKRVRKNLREILKLFYYDESKRLRELAGRCLITTSGRKEHNKLTRISAKLDHAYEKSILECSSGAMCTSYKEMVEKRSIKPSERPINLDMVWIPHEKAWFCTKCYERKYKIKHCENCQETDERMVKISECFICDRYICESCKNQCLDCHEFYCDQCFYEHFDREICQVSGGIPKID